MNNFIIIILDGVGVGELPDAAAYGDSGSNTLYNLAKHVGQLTLPTLQKLGLGNIIEIPGIEVASDPLASYGKLKEVSKGKDSTTGHWEIGGFEVTFEFPYYPDGFPDRIVNAFIKETGVGGILGNKAASGTEIIKELGDEHVKTGFPIVYTSADSVFQIAAHEEIISIEKLYEICTIAREKILINKDSVGRVIARPFVGSTNNYVRTTNRKDFSMDPVDETILDLLFKSNIKTVAIGKINDLYNYRGINHGVKTKSNHEGIQKILYHVNHEIHSLIFTNLVDFDVYYGHRNDPEGFAKALKEFDDQLPLILDSMDETDALIITSDHGNDPTTISTDHSREYVPLLYFRKNRPGIDLGTRETMSDIAKTAADFFELENNFNGISFLK